MSALSLLCLRFFFFNSRGDCVNDVLRWDARCQITHAACRGLLFHDMQHRKSRLKGTRASRDVISYLAHATSSPFYRVLPPKRESFSLSLSLVCPRPGLFYFCFSFAEINTHLMWLFKVKIQIAAATHTAHSRERNVKGHFNGICCFLWFAHVAKKNMWGKLSCMSAKVLFAPAQNTSRFELIPAMFVFVEAKASGKQQ